MQQDSDVEQYVVVRNHEHQYSVWWASREIPAGWETAGPIGTREACLEHIERVWTDMRPLSLRRWLQEHAPEDAQAPE